MESDFKADRDGFEAGFEARLRQREDRIVAGIESELRASEERILSVINGYAEISRLRMRECQIRESMPEQYRGMVVY